MNTTTSFTDHRNPIHHPSNQGEKTMQTKKILWPLIAVILVAVSFTSVSAQTNAEGTGTEQQTEAQAQGSGLHVFERLVDIEADGLDERRQGAQDRGRLRFGDVARRVRVESVPAARSGRSERHDRPRLGSPARHRSSQPSGREA